MNLFNDEISLSDELNARRQSIFLFEQLLETPRDLRLNNLIAKFINGFAFGWKFAVKECFKDALDIKMTEREKDLLYTQGSAFNFSPGDTFYDSVIAYEKWDTALKNIAFCIQVIRAIPAQPGTTQNYIRKNPDYTKTFQGRRKEIMKFIGNEWMEVTDTQNIVKENTGKKFGVDTLEKLIEIGAIEKNVIIPRFSGSVEFRKFEPNQERTKIICSGESKVTHDEFVKILINGFS